MFDPKPMASLSSGLLARKGHAHPAISRAHRPMAAVAPPTPWRSQAEREESNGGPDWNDLATDIPAKSAVVGVRLQQENLARSLARAAQTAAQSLQPRKAKAAFTLRLDAERHLRLRLASAVGHRSAQQIVIEALDAFLDNQPGLDVLVAHARQNPSGSVES